MSSKEIDRDTIFSKVKDGQLNLVKASQLSGLSYPQAGLVHPCREIFGQK